MLEARTDHELPNTFRSKKLACTWPTRGVAISSTFGIIHEFTCIMANKMKLALADTLHTIWECSKLVCIVSLANSYLILGLLKRKVPHGDYSARS